eukprot:m.71472 g.71472  ORF g.71472 m.71472 type:complete len:369 (+) comp20168_c0_seq1:72-1178(+)
MLCLLLVLVVSAAAAPLPASQVRLDVSSAFAAVAQSKQLTLEVTLGTNGLSINGQVLSSESITKIQANAQIIDSASGTTTEAQVLVHAVVQEDTSETHTLRVHAAVKEVNGEQLTNSEVTEILIELDEQKQESTRKLSTLPYEESLLAEQYEAELFFDEDESEIEDEIENEIEGEIEGGLEDLPLQTALIEAPPPGPEGEIPSTSSPFGDSSSSSSPESSSSTPYEASSPSEDTSSSVGEATTFISSSSSSPSIGDESPSSAGWDFFVEEEYTTPTATVPGNSTSNCAIGRWYHNLSFIGKVAVTGFATFFTLLILFVFYRLVLACCRAAHTSVRPYPLSKSRTVYLDSIQVQYSALPTEPKTKSLAL